MLTLFPDTPGYPNGFAYEPGFLSEAEEGRLLRDVEQLELHAFQFQGYTAKRRVASFGYDWSFGRRQLLQGKPVPDALEWLVEKVAEKLSLSVADFAEVLVTEYPAGAVINSHRDAPPFALIAGVSLNADCVFKLRPHEKEKQARKSVLSFPVERRSLYVMQGEARSEWQHSIDAVARKRYSVTLRTLRPGSLKG